MRTPKSRSRWGHGLNGRVRAMLLGRKTFSSDQLPSGLGEADRFRAWAELCERTFTTTAEFERSEGASFNARMEVVALGTTALARSRGTFSTIRRGRRQILSDHNDRYCLTYNVEGRPVHGSHRGRDFDLRPGAFALLKLDEGFATSDRGVVKSWMNIHVPVAALTTTVPALNDLLGRELAPGGALSLAMSYAGLVLGSEPLAFEQAGVHIASHLADLISLGLGARGDAAELARRGGLRAARLEAVLRALKKAYTDPELTAARLADALNLSERYVNRLLFETGASFGTRLLELRLQKALQLLAASTPRRVGDIALDCGFNDLSYFNRCFRRRFGLTPTMARGGAPL